MLVLIRHAECEIDCDTVWVGRGETPLSPVGMAQATAAGRELSDLAFDAVFCAPPQQAMMTCTEILRHNQKTSLEPKGIRVTDALAERFNGTLEGRTHKVTIKEFPRRKWLEWERNYYVSPPEGESLAQVADRVTPLFEMEIKPLLKAGLNVLVVGHENTLRVLIGHINRMEEGDICDIRIDYAIPYVFNNNRFVSAS